MGKIVKFCSSCDEGFAEKFGFCPNCGQSLQAFEMNPLEAAAAAPVAEAAPVIVPPAPEFIQPAAETVEFEDAVADVPTEVIEEPIIEIEEAPIEMAAPEAEEFELGTRTRSRDVDRTQAAVCAANARRC